MKMKSDNLLTDNEFEELIDMAKSKNKYTAVSIKNPILGEIVLPHGRIDNETKRGYGYEHLVYERLFKDNLNNDEIAGLIIRTLEVLKTASEDNVLKLKTRKNRIIIEKNEIRIALAKERFMDSDMWIITSYPLFEDKTKTIKKEALVSLRTAHATKGYAQHYSFFRNAVGALTSRFIIEKNKQNVNGGQKYDK